MAGAITLNNLLPDMVRTEHAACMLIEGGTIGAINNGQLVPVAVHGRQEMPVVDQLFHEASPYSAWAADDLSPSFSRRRFSS